MDRTVEDIVWFAALIYFAPALIAVIRGHLSSVAILVLNVALGWTLLGWFVALIWSFTGSTRANSRRVTVSVPAADVTDELFREFRERHQHYVEIKRPD